MKISFLGKEISGRFTIPSGVVTTDINIIKKIVNLIPELGVITTKSIGLEPRKGNLEPIITQYAPGCFLNAVGLTNPGSKEFAKQLSKIKIPNDKFLLISIFGKDENEFVEIIKDLQTWADGFELNFSCPHAKGYGMSIGQDPEMVKNIIKAIKKLTSLPVVAKLTPNILNIAEIAKAAVEGGADAICAINTVGPGYYTINGNSVLSNQKGGLSGKGIFPIGLKCIKEICDIVNVPVIACGGISSVDEVFEYEKAGAKIFGIGSALAGLSTEKMKRYFAELESDYRNKTNNAINILDDKVNLNFTKYKLVKIQQYTDDLSVFVFDKPIKIKSGQFVFLWIPGIGERPFSVLDNNPLTLVVKKIGCFTEKLFQLKEDEEVYFRGPYGVPINIDDDKKIFLVGGGTGIAALYQIARDFKNVEMFFGARNENYLYYIKQIKENCLLNIATEDGSVGYKGLVSEILEERLKQINKNDDPIFYNCGPEVMIRIVNDIQKKYFPNSKIFNSIEYVMKCGIGICGSCANDNGDRTCVDGPFI